MIRAPTVDQMKWLRWLRDGGGSGYIDRYGRVVCNGLLANQGALISWLNLVAKGLIDGADDRIQITEAGRAVLEQWETA